MPSLKDKILQMRSEQETASTTNIPSTADIKTSSIATVSYINEKVAETKKEPLKWSELFKKVAWGGAIAFVIAFALLGIACVVKLGLLVLTAPFPAA